MKYLLFFCIALTVIYQNCSEHGIVDFSSQAAYNSIKYFQTTQKIIVHVYYEPNAEPYAGSMTGGTPYWNVVEQNLSAIFQYRSSPPQLTVPKALGDMTSIAAQNKTSWTDYDLFQLSLSFGNTSSPANESHFHIYFLRGYYNDGTQDQPNVLGVSYTGTTYIALFKDVIKNSAHAGGPLGKFIEQSTLVHEIGHSLGFVNNGVPMAVDHQDVAHGKHTTNSNCVMYWLNEGLTDMANFAQKFLTSTSYVMWGPEVLTDARALSK
jgi:hypothetical protein